MLDVHRHARFKGVLFDEQVVCLENAPHFTLAFDNVLIEDEIILTTTLPRIKAVSLLFELYLRREGGYPDFHY